MHLNILDFQNKNSKNLIYWSAFENSVFEACENFQFSKLFSFEFTNLRFVILANFICEFENRRFSIFAVAKFHFANINKFPQKIVDFLSGGVQGVGFEPTKAYTNRPWTYPLWPLGNPCSLEYKFHIWIYLI